MIVLAIAGFLMIVSILMVVITFTGYRDLSAEQQSVLMKFAIWLILLAMYIRM